MRKWAWPHRDWHCSGCSVADGLRWTDQLMSWLCLHFIQRPSSLWICCICCMLHLINIISCSYMWCLIHMMKTDAFLTHYSQIDPWVYAPASLLDNFGTVTCADGIWTPLSWHVHLGTRLSWALTLEKARLVIMSVLWRLWHSSMFSHPFLHQHSSGSTFPAWHCETLTL